MFWTCSLSSSTTWGSESRHCMLFDWLLRYYSCCCPSYITFLGCCVRGQWLLSSEVWFSSMADCICANSRAFNRALKSWKSFKTELHYWIFRAFRFYELHHYRANNINSSPSAPAHFLSETTFRPGLPWSSSGRNEQNEISLTYMYSL